MPSVSKSQQRLMHAVVRNPALSLKTGVPVSVAREYVRADHMRGSTKLPEKKAASYRKGPSHSSRP